MNADKRRWKMAVVSALMCVYPWLSILAQNRAEHIREFLGLGPKPDAAAAGRGAVVYVSNCGFCHGDQARGASGPDLLRSPLVLHDERGELIGPLLARGRPDRGMPAFPALTPSQRYEIAEFLHQQVELAANRGTYKRLNIVTGDAKKGERYFNGAGRCNTCHLPAGDLAHIAARYPQPDQLQNRFVWPGGRGGNGGKKAKVTLASGETISGTIRHIDDFEISLVDSAGNYRAWPREGIKVEIEDRLAAHRRLLDRLTDEDMHNVTAYLVTLK